MAGWLAGKVAMITSGSSGIGLATAQRFVTEGTDVFITGRRQAELDRAKSLIGEHATAVQGDVARLADLDRLFEPVRASKGVVDIVVASAGFFERAPSVPTMMRHRPPGSLALRVLNDHLDHAYGSNAHRRRDGGGHERRP